MNFEWKSFAKPLLWPVSCVACLLLGVICGVILSPRRPTISTPAAASLPTSTATIPLKSGEKIGKPSFPVTWAEFRELLSQRGNVVFQNTNSPDCFTGTVEGTTATLMVWTANGLVEHVECWVFTDKTTKATEMTSRLELLSLIEIALADTADAPAGTRFLVAVGTFLLVDGSEATLRTNELKISISRSNFEGINTHVLAFYPPKAEPR